MRVTDLGRQIVERRLQTLEYIKRVYAGECHWLSVALLPSSDEANKQLDKQAKDAETAQALRWFYLGVSIAPLIIVPAGPIFVRALLQLFEEYQYHFASTARINIRKISRLGRPSRWGLLSKGSTWRLTNAPTHACITLRQQAN